MRLLTCLIFLLLGLAASAQTSLSARGGQYLSVQVLGVPDNASTALLDLNPSLTGLRLTSQGDGVWTGAFILLPDMVPGTINPEVRLLDRSQVELAKSGSKISVALASSDLDQRGLATVLSDRRATFVFGPAIKADSIRFITDAGLIAPDLSDDTFTLPARIAAANVSAVVAETTAGVDLTFSPNWDTDQAGVEENL